MWASPFVAVDDLEGHAFFGLLAHFGEFAADEALGGEDGVLGVGDGLAFGGLADEALAGLGESHDGRRGAGAFGVVEHHRLAAFHDGHAGIGGAQVNAENTTHADLISRACAPVIGFRLTLYA